MTPDLHRRCAVLLFAALAMAVACGLLVAPPLDPWSPLRRVPVAGVLVAAVVQGALAWLGLSLAMRWLWPDAGTWPRVLLAAPVAGALAWWVGSLLLSDQADARALCWLQSLPVWAIVAGLSGGRSLQTRHLLRRPSIDQTTFSHTRQQAVEDLRVVEQGDVRSPRNVQASPAGQARAGSRKDNVVAMTEGTQEQLPA